MNYHESHVSRITIDINNEIFVSASKETSPILGHKRTGQRNIIYKQKLMPVRPKMAAKKKNRKNQTRKAIAKLYSLHRNALILNSKIRRSMKMFPKCYNSSNAKIITVFCEDSSGNVIHLAQF